MTTPTTWQMRRDLDDWRGYPASGEVDTPDTCDFCGGAWGDHRMLEFDRDGKLYAEARMCPIETLASALEQLERARLACAFAAHFFNDYPDLVMAAEFFDAMPHDWRTALEVLVPPAPEVK